MNPKEKIGADEHVIMEFRPKKKTELEIHVSTGSPQRRIDVLLLDVENYKRFESSEEFYFLAGGKDVSEFHTVYPLAKGCYKLLIVNWSKRKSVTVEIEAGY